jgi:hypothetical protein
MGSKKRLGEKTSDYAHHASRRKALVILDTADRPDLEEFIRVHQYAGPGDVTSQWAALEDSSGRVGLMLTFSGRMELTVVLAFNPGAQFGLVDQIIRAKGLYLQVGRPDDRLTIKPNAPKSHREYS